MHSHDPDAFARIVGLTLDFDIVGFKARQKPGQAGHLALFIGQGLIEQFVNPVFRLRTQAGDQAAASVVPGQGAFDQVIRRQKVGLLPQVIQIVQRLRMALRLIAQGLPQIAGPAMGQIVKFGFRPAHKRRPQQGGKRQIIFRRRQKRQQRRQILDRHFRPKLQAIRPGNRQVDGLAGPDDFGKQG